ncbi:hypothetical protein M0802_014173 [Mischocyttarus mexicanus]|nr:hypothetical protein M0802_014317 [Mischocyttarus mexicanus]KAI4480482.1 hypothetical protein M0802_014173 [Mischocyttarus mexicanus]
MDFNNLILVLWELYSSGVSVKLATEIVSPEYYFHFPDVRRATIHYWYHRFSTNFYFPSIIPIIKTLSYNLRLEYLMVMTSIYPSWSIYHYMDALKVHKKDAKTYLQIVANIRSGRQAPL